MKKPGVFKDLIDTIGNIHVEFNEAGGNLAGVVASRAGGNRAKLFRAGWTFVAGAAGNGANPAYL